MLTIRFRKGKELQSIDAIFANDDFFLYFVVSLRKPSSAAFERDIDIMVSRYAIREMEFDIILKKKTDR